jgi:hypothetical protein
VAYLIFLLADSQSRARSGLPRTQAKEITTRDLFLFCVYCTTLRSLVVDAANRLASRSKLPKLERARFWGYSEVYCVAVARSRARARGGAAGRQGRCNDGSRSCARLWGRSGLA